MRNSLKTELVHPYLIVGNNELDNMVNNCINRELRSSRVNCVRDGDSTDFLLTGKLNIPPSLGCQLEIFNAMKLVEMVAKLCVGSGVLVSIRFAGGPIGLVVQCVEFLSERTINLRKDI